MTKYKQLPHPGERLGKLLSKKSEKEKEQIALALGWEMFQLRNYISGGMPLMKYDQLRYLTALLKVDFVQLQRAMTYRPCNLTDFKPLDKMERLFKKHNPEQNYSDDFYKHDKETIEKWGMDGDFLWCVGQYGTHFLFIEKDNAEFIENVIRNYPENKYFKLNYKSIKPIKNEDLDKFVLSFKY